MNNSIEFGKEQIQNAKIKFTQSGISDNDTLMMQIGFELAGGRVVSTPKFSFNCDKMKDILNILELRNWEELPKKYARVKVFNDKVISIGNILNDKWIKI